jgi:hypothetical protein
VADAVGHHPSRTGTIARRAAVLLRTARHDSCFDLVSTEIGVRDMQTTYATTDVAPHNRRQFWQEVVSRTYFPLDLSFAGGNEFNGSLGAWSLGPVSVSRIVSDGLLYKRHERHLLNEREECYLITVPELAEIRFAQDGKDVRCRPGAFLIERSHLPYEFSHRNAAALWVLKIHSAVLRARISRPERLATLQFDASRSVGALFVDTLRLTGARIEEIDEPARTMTGKHLIDLLAMAIESDARVLVGHSSSVRNGWPGRSPAMTEDGS